MTYVPPEREDEDGEQRDQTQQLTAVPGALPSVGNGDMGGQSAPFQPEASPTVPFASDRGEASGADFAEAKPPRDRLVFQLVWEAILVLLTLNALFLVYQQRSEIFGDQPLMDTANTEMARLAPLLLLVTALGLSLRLGAVNLAVPAMAFLVLSAPTMFVSTNPWMGLGITAVAAVVTTAVFTVLALALRIPAWMTGLALAFAIVGAAPLMSRLAADLNLESGSGWTAPDGMWLFAGAAVISLAGGLLGLAPGVRDRFTRVKGALEGTEPREAASVLALFGGTFLSLFLAGSAGFLVAVFQSGEAMQGGSVFGSFSSAGGPTLLLTPFVLIAVLLGGTSLWGRRGGIAGTLLATVLLWSAILLRSNLEAPSSDPELFNRWDGVIFAGALLVGVVVSVVLDRLGRPKVSEPLEEQPMEGAGVEGQFSPNQGGLFEPGPGADQNGQESMVPRS
ncbi:hypothetical protein GCM10027447_21180 [Glycomyces halotolerans]